MAKIHVVGNALVIKSGCKLEDIKTLEKYNPKALALYDEEGKVTFKVGTTTAQGSINQYGASFRDASMDDEKKATITLAIPAGITNAAEYAEEVVGVAILNLNKVEEGVGEAIAEVAAERAKIRESITVA